jgi:hypothetical protein
MVRSSETLATKVFGGRRLMVCKVLNISSICYGNFNGTDRMYKLVAVDWVLELRSRCSSSPFKRYSTMDV